MNQTEIVALTLDAVPKRWDRLDVLEQGDRESVDFALILHDEEGVVGCDTNEGGLSIRISSFHMQDWAIAVLTDITEKLDRRSSKRRWTSNGLAKKRPPRLMNAAKAHSTLQ